MLWLALPSQTFFFYHGSAAPLTLTDMFQNPIGKAELPTRQEVDHDG